MVDQLRTLLLDVHVLQAFPRNMKFRRAWPHTRTAYNSKDIRLQTDLTCASWPSLVGRTPLGAGGRVKRKVWLEFLGPSGDRQFGVVWKTQCHPLCSKFVQHSGLVNFVFCKRE